MSYLKPVCDLDVDLIYSFQSIGNGLDCLARCQVRLEGSFCLVSKGPLVHAKV